MLELLLKLYAHSFPDQRGANKENVQRKPNFLERKRLLDYGGSGDLDDLDGNNKNKPKSGFQLKPDEEEDDDIESEPWDHGKAAL